MITAKYIKIKSGFIIPAVLVFSILAIVWFLSGYNPNTPMKQLNAKSVRVQGIVHSTLEQEDGALILLEKKDDITVTVRLLDDDSACAVSGLFFYIFPIIRLGDKVEVFGAVTPEGEIIPCDSSQHYIRPLGIEGAAGFPRAIVLRDWSIYSNRELGISFRYLPGWGRLVTRDVQRCTNTIQPCVYIDAYIDFSMRAVMAAKGSNFNSGSLNVSSDPLAQKFQIEEDSKRFIATYCDRQINMSCVTKVSSLGVTYIESVETTFFQGKDREVRYYFAYHPNHPFPIVAFSTHAFLGTSFEPSAREVLEFIITTLEFF